MPDACRPWVTSRSLCGRLHCRLAVLSRSAMAGHRSTYAATFRQVCMFRPQSVGLIGSSWSFQASGSPQAWTWKCIVGRHPMLNMELRQDSTVRAAAATPAQPMMLIYRQMASICAFHPAVRLTLTAFIACLLFVMEVHDYVIDLFTRQAGHMHHIHSIRHVAVCTQMNAVWACRHQCWRHAFRHGSWIDVSIC